MKTYIVIIVIHHPVIMISGQKLYRDIKIAIKSVHGKLNKIFNRFSLIEILIALL